MSNPPVQYPAFPLWWNHTGWRAIFRQSSGVFRIGQNDIFYDENLKKVRPDYIIHGDNWNQGYQKEVKERAARVMAEWGGEIIEIPYYEKDVSYNATYSSLKTPTVTSPYSAAFLMILMWPVWIISVDKHIYTFFILNSLSYPFFVKYVYIFSQYKEFDYVFSGHSHIPHDYQYFYESDDKSLRYRKRTVFIKLCGCFSPFAGKTSEIFIYYSMLMISPDINNYFLFWNI